MATLPTSTTHQSSGSPSLGLDQELVGSADLINNLVPYLISLKNQVGSWEIPSLSGDSTVYWGIAGGLAGVGLELLRLAEFDSDLITPTTRETALVLAEEIGSYLESQASGTSPNRHWTIANDSDVVDLGYDFGVAGISYFFAELYNATEDITYKALASDGFTYIDSQANYTSGLHWNSSMAAVLDRSSWYPQDLLSNFFDASYTSDETYFNSRSLGTTGVAQAAFDTIKLLTITDSNANEYKILNNSLYWINSQFTVDIDVGGNERSLNMSYPSIGIKPTSVSHGVSGVLSLALDLYDFYGNATYLTWADELVNWLNGTASNTNRLLHSAEINGTLSSTIQLGVNHGIAGNIKVLADYVDRPGASAYEPDLEDSLYALHNLGTEDDGFYKYAASIRTGDYVNLDSTSFANGGPGILNVVDQLADNLGISNLDDDISKAKSYFYDTTITSQNLSVIPWDLSGQPEFNPSVGFMSLYPMLNVSIPGQLHVPAQSLDYGMVELGNSVSKAIQLQNLGDEPITAQWNDLSSSSIFSVASTSEVIEARSVFNLFVSFIPTAEDDYSEILTISTDSTSFTVEVVATSFDTPQIELSEGPTNGTTLTNRSNIEFVVNVTDTSGIAQVTFSVNNQSQIMTSTADSSIYRATWDMSAIQNGTYTVLIKATDTLGYNTSTFLQYTVGIPETSLQDRIFSNTTLYILSGLAGVLLLASIFITRRYRS